MLDRGPSTQPEFDAMLQSLVGRRIETVTYFEIAYQDGEPMWGQDSPRFDSLDFGLTWKLDDGTLFSYTWDTEFTQYNVSIRQDALAFREVATWHVTERWAPWVGRTISSATAMWLPSEVDGGSEDHPSVDYPQQINICFEEAPPIAIAACEFRDRVPMWMMDHITVFFGAENIPG